MTLTATFRSMLSAALFVMLTTSTALAFAQQPNFVVIVADDQSPETLSCYGNTVCDTPTLDRLAANGLILHDAHHMGSWSGAVCTPSRTMIMTGRTVWNIPGANGPGLQFPNDRRRDVAQQSMPAVFNRAGYDTFRTCKRGNSFNQANELFTVSHVASKRNDDSENGGSSWHGDRAVEFLQAREESGDDDPFLMYVGFSLPHDPRNASAELAAKYGADNQGPGDEPDPRAPSLPDTYLPEHPFHHGHPGLRDEEKVQGVLTRRDEATIRNELGREFACIEEIDRQVGRVLEQLNAMGELENTYIIYTSDHGIAVGRHGLTGKQNLYEHTWRVPFLISGPGIESGSHASGYIYLMDILPTLCDLAGIETPESVEGISFRPVLEGDADAVRDVMYGVYCGGTKPGMRSVKSDGWKLIEYNVLDGDVRETQLFDLRANPREYLQQHHHPDLVRQLGNRPEVHQIDLAESPDHRVKLLEMKALLALQMATLGDPYADMFGEPTSSEEFDVDRAIIEEHAIPHGRLPARHETHAATITEANDGTLIASWYAGTREGNTDVKIWCSRKEPGGEWSEPVVVDDGVREVDGNDVEFACWNPVLFTHPDGEVYLYYKITGSGDRFGPRNWWGAVRTSHDHGRSWSDRIWLPRVSTEGDGSVFAAYDGIAAGPIKNRPIMLPDGSLLCGSSTEGEAGWRLHFERYQPNDWTGQKHGVQIIGPYLEGKEAIQPSFLIHSSDMKRLQVLTREDGTSWSEDQGQSWTQVENGPIDTSKGLHAVTSDDGWHFLAFNPAGRTPLSLARSRDGMTWTTILPVLKADGDLKMDYPSMMIGSDGNLHIVHSYGRDHIRHLVVDLAYVSRDE